MLNLQWIYEPHVRMNPSLQALKTTLLNLFEERFLLLVDATYLYLIDRDVKRKKQRWDEHKKKVCQYSLCNFCFIWTAKDQLETNSQQVQRVIKSLPSLPSLIGLTPPIGDFPIHMILPSQVHDIWSR
jgi:hypothetical protein